MDHSRLPQRRTLLIGLAAVGLVPLAGCMTKPMRPANADGTYCFAIGKWHSRKFTCTTAPIPSEQVEMAAKRFEAVPDMLTVYVVRKRWGDARNAVRLTPHGRCHRDGPRVTRAASPEAWITHTGGRLGRRPCIHRHRRCSR